MSLEEGAATVTAFVAESIAKAVYDFCPEQPRQIIVCGGGAKNPTIVRFLRQRLKNIELSTAEECGFDAMGIEAQAFAFLAVRRIQHIPTSYPFTTGAITEIIGGEIFEPKKRLIR